MMWSQDASGTWSLSPVLGDINAFADISITETINVDGANQTASVWQINGIDYLLTFNSLGTNPEFIAGSFNSDTTAFATNTTLESGIDILRGTNIGMYQAGFYPTMMFGLPAVAIAMAMRAEDEHKKAVWAFMLAGSIVAFLTGITEPLEFAFMFISPVIYVVYSALSGVWAMIVILFGASNGFGFSAGLIDWIISILGGGIGVMSAHGNWASLEILLVGAVAAAVNFTVVYFLIGKLDIATPGRNGNVTGLTQVDDEDEVENSKDKKKSKNSASKKLTTMAEKTIDFIGRDNIEKIDNCITRVRLTVKDNTIYDDEEVKKIGYSGVVKVGKKAYQMIIGPESEVIANEMRRLIEEGYGK